MKLSMISKSVLLGAALLLTTTVFAASKGPLQIQETLNVSGHALPVGEYQVKWDGTGPNVELNIMQGKKVLATVPARMIDLNQSAPYDAYLVRTNADGSKSLSKILFSGKKFALALNQEAAKAENGESSGK